jgi:hypothetical protein
MVIAIRSAARLGRMAAEAEIFRAGIAHRPFARALRQHQYVDPLALWNVDEANGFGLGLRPDHGLRPVHRFQCGGAVDVQVRPSRMRWFPRPARSGAGGPLRRHAAGKTEPVNFSDDGIAGYAIAEPSSDLAGTQSFIPIFFEQLDPIFRPGWFVVDRGVSFVLKCYHSESLLLRRTGRPRASKQRLTGKRYILCIAALKITIGLESAASFRELFPQLIPPALINEG